MNELNRIYFKFTKLSIFAVFLNFTLSCVYIIPNHYGTNTFTSLLSFGLLVLMKLFSAYKISFKSIKEELAYSAFMKTSITYNVIDDNYVKIEKEDINELKETDINVEV